MFEYHQPNLENMQQYLSQESERGDGPNWWSIPAGMSSVRILPPWDPSGRVALPVFMHPIEYKGEGMSFTKYNWTCVNRTFSKPCAICEGLASLSAAGVDVGNWEANRRQYYFNAIIMQDPTYDQKGKGVAPGTHVLMKAPKTFYDWVVAQITNPMIGDITRVDNGIDIYITKKGSGLGTEYNMTLSPNGRTPVPQEYLEKITSLYNMDEIFSAGFDQKQIDDLVNHLKKSAGAMSNAVGNAVNQMAGYTQAPMNMPINQPINNPAYGMPNQFGGVAPATTGYPPINNPVAPTSAPSMPAPSPFGGTSAPSMPTQFGGTGMPSPMGVPATSPFTQAAPSIPTNVQTPPWQAPAAPAAQPSVPKENTPKCYGQYDPGNVNCVVCPVEMDCARTKG